MIKRTKTNERSRYFPHVREVTRRLLQRYGHQRLGNKRDPFAELLFVILSSKTPPSRYRLTYRALRSAFPSPDDLARVEPTAIAKVIEVGGLADKKAHQISEITRTLVREFGRVTLRPLAKMRDHKAELFLDKLPGIGKKMARCVLMYALDRAVFPVDAHCFRICRRLGWASSTIGLTDRTADELQAGIPAGLRHDLHVGMILLGREFCLANRPKCLGCPLLPCCPTGQVEVAARSAERDI